MLMKRNIKQSILSRTVFALRLVQVGPISKKISEHQRLIFAKKQSVIGFASVNIYKTQKKSQPNY